VKALRGKVVPKFTDNKKADCTPEKWAAKLDYMKAAKKRWYATHSDRERERGRKWNAANRAKVRERNRRWRESHPGATSEACRKWRTANKDRHDEGVRKWYANNALRKSEYNRQYDSQNKEHRKLRAKTNYKQRRASDPHFRLMGSIRTRQGKFFKGKSRSLSMVRDMGCDREFFLRHIISQFTAGMTMENYVKLWHLDHIYPLSRADIVDNPIHFLAAANWRNIQPMLGPENLKKSDAVTPEAQALFDQLRAEFSSYDEAHGEELVPF
jgi:hypothetical protein